jgi:hypothetical protein
MNALPFSLPFAQSTETLASRLAEFHGRHEVAWLGLAGRFEAERVAAWVAPARPRSTAE